MANTKSKKETTKVKKVLTLKEQMVSDSNFQGLCKKVGFEPTTRQYSKFRLDKGKVYRLGVLKHNPEQMQLSI